MNLLLLFMSFHISHPTPVPSQRMETPTQVNDEKSIVFASEDGSDDRRTADRDATDAESAAFEIESATSPSASRRQLEMHADDRPCSQPEARGSGRHVPADASAAASASQASLQVVNAAESSSPQAEATPRESATVHDDQSIHFDETSSVATSHHAHLAAAAATTTTTDIEFAEERADLGQRGDDEMSTMFAVAATDDESICFAAQSEKNRVVTPERHSLVAANSSINFALQDEESKDLTTETNSNALLQTRSSSRRSPVVKPAEHVSPWNNASVKSPHHSRYQPGKVATIEEQEWAKQHPMWTKPKGSTIVAKSPEATPAADSADATQKGSDYPYGQFGPRAKQYSEKLRREASEKSLRKSSSASLREEGPTPAQDGLHGLSTADCTHDSKKAAASPSNSANRIEGRRSTESKPRSKQEKKVVTPSKPHVPPRQLKEQVEQWMNDHVPTERRVQQDEVSISSGSEGEQQQKDREPKEKSPKKEGSRPNEGGESSPKNAPRVAAVTPLSHQTPGRSSSAGHLQGTQERASAHHHQALTERPGNAPVAAIFDKLYHQGGKQAREAYIKEQQEREEAELKLKRLIMLYGVAKGQREYDRLYGAQGGTGDAPKRSNTPPAWQRLYTTPTKRTASVEADKNKSQQRSTDRGRPQSALPETQRRRPSIASAKESSKASPRPQPNEDEIFSRLYKMGVTEMQRKQKLADEAAMRRLKQEQEEIERGKILARALRQKSGHQPMTREEYEAFLKSQAEQAHSTEPKLTEDQLNAVYARLLKQGKKKVNQALVDKIELKECTFHPVVNPSPTRGRSAHPLTTTTSCTTDDSGAFPARQRSPSCDKACLKLYQNAEKVKNGRHELHDRVDRERRLKLLKARMNSDHHFLRRVQLDPSVAEAFMAALPPQA